MTDQRVDRIGFKSQTDIGTIKILVITSINYLILYFQDHNRLSNIPQYFPSHTFSHPLKLAEPIDAC